MHFYQMQSDSISTGDPIEGQNQLDLEANRICSNVHSSCQRALDATYQMPLNEHVYYSSFESYDRIMVDQRATLADMMNNLTEVGSQANSYGFNHYQYNYVQSHQNQYPPQYQQQHQQQQNYQPTTHFNQQTQQQHHHHQHQQSQQQQQQQHQQSQQHPPIQQNQIISHNKRAHNYYNCETIENLQDSYDQIQEFTELMLDDIGQNLDHASGITSREAQMVKATLEAANKNKQPTKNQQQHHPNNKNLNTKLGSNHPNSRPNVIKPNQNQPQQPLHQFGKYPDSNISQIGDARQISASNSNNSPSCALQSTNQNSTNVTNNSLSSSPTSSSSSLTTNSQQATITHNSSRLNNESINNSGTRQQINNNPGNITSKKTNKMNLLPNQQVSPVTQSSSPFMQPATRWKGGVNQFGAHHYSTPGIAGTSVGGYMGKQFGSYTPQRFAQLENKNIPRPQTQFIDKIDNSYRPFQPIIKDKPNAVVPLKIISERDDHGNEFYSHPYEFELQNMVIESELLTPVDPIEPRDLESTPIIYVDTVEQLEDMCKHIENEKEFAVDVEHHSYRSFQGITCLLQISTRTQDFVIDAIKLRGELYRLNQSFTNSSIVKVFHGADCDVLWLQRDFGIYVVKLFDTSRAAKLMKFAHLSLAFLLQHYCNIEPDKSYQLADWRERPLPLPMLQYARADTHFLLYIYDRLRNDLLTKAKNKAAGCELLRNVYERGVEICLKRYEKPPFSDTSHMSVLRKSRTAFKASNMYAFKELYAWRDSISRQLDESLGYVLPNNLMIRIAEYLPREPQGITALCNPMPPTVKKYLSDIHAIIQRALNLPSDEISKVTTGKSLTPSIKSIDLDTINHKHDIAHSAGLNEGVVPNLLDKLHLTSSSVEERSEEVDESGGADQEVGGNKDDKSIDEDNRSSRRTPSRLYSFLNTSSESLKSRSDEK